jgi:hypothetical protein
LLSLVNKIFPLHIMMIDLVLGTETQHCHIMSCLLISHINFLRTISISERALDFSLIFSSIGCSSKRKRLEWHIFTILSSALQMVTKELKFKRKWEFLTNIGRIDLLSSYAKFSARFIIIFFLFFRFSVDANQSIS